MHLYHTSRTVEWGNWGITLMDTQPDKTKNYGVIVGFVRFPLGTRGPFVSPKMQKRFEEICKNWIEFKILPTELEQQQ